MEQNDNSLYWRLHHISLWLIFVMFLFSTALLQGCGESNGGGSDGSTTTNVYDPSRDYYDQLWDIAKESINPDMADDEIAETLARWIVSNSTNARWVPEDSIYPLPDGALGLDDALLPFHGRCTKRSLLFQNLGERAGLTVSMFNMYNFSGPGDGHSCVQVYYEGDWHFYDVTYAGMFKVNDEVLSFAEMRADLDSAIAGMVVFEPTGDVRDYYSNGLRVDNSERMQDAYTKEALANAISTSFLGSENLVPLEVLFDLSILPIYVGDLAGSSADLDADGSNQNISQCLGTMLGYVRDNFEPLITLRNAVPGQAYVLRFFIYHSTGPGLLFRVSSTNGVDIISGSELTTSAEMLWPTTSVAWEIILRPLADEASFTIHHDCGEGHGLLLNYIAVEVAD